MPANNDTTLYILSMLYTYNAFGVEDEQYIKQVIDILELKNNYFFDVEADNAGLRARRKSFLQGTYSPPSEASATAAPALSENGSKIFFTTTMEAPKTDEFARFALSTVITKWLGLSTLFSEANLAELEDKTGTTGSGWNIDQAFQNFIFQEYYLLDENIDLFSLLCVNRLKIWLGIWQQNGTVSPDLAFVEESKTISEFTVIEGEDEQSDPTGSTNTTTANNLSFDGSNNLIFIWDKVFSTQVTGYEAGFDNIHKVSFINRSPSSDQKNSFYRVFSKISSDILDENQPTKAMLSSFGGIVNRLISFGFFELASYAYEISEFAKKRSANVSSVQKSAFEFIDPAVDQVWIDKLIQVEYIIRKDPVLFYNIINYFPSLAIFILDALTITSDYSNGGLGGGSEDILNDPEAFLDSLEKAFGMENGKAVFTLANRFTNTAKRIKDVIESSPYRDNTPPENPDIFHLRLGAANFYVPPLTIDINSSFKAGSLMGAALRQRSSPKFNSGYKETTIRMKLFFPNYEEIWGITIDDASSITLNEDFKIDFRANGDSDAKIDKFLSSLRGLVAAFKYSPFLPIKNHYLNSVHGITAVGLSSMTIATIPNFPFALAVDLELVNFNHKPFLPMITDFNQAIHWGKYRQYMGKAAGHLSKYVSEEFLLKTTDLKETDAFPSEGILEGELVTTGTFNGSAIDPDNPPDSNDIVITEAGEYRPFQADVLKTNILSEWRNGNHLTLFSPAEAQTKMYLPSTSSFRNEEEKIMTDLGESFWDSLLKKIGIDVNQSASYGISLAETVDISRENAYNPSIFKTITDLNQIWTAGANPNSQQDSIYEFLTTTFIQQNSSTFPNTDEGKAVKAWFKDRNNPYDAGYTEQLSYIFQGQYITASLYAVKNAFEETANNPKSMLDFLIDNHIANIEGTTGQAPDYDKVKQEFSRAFNVVMYENFFRSGPVQALMEASRLKSGHILFREWEVPMLRVDLDPNSVIINGVTVSLGNSLVKLQVQMLDEPTYQHIGGRDSYINISMTVIGEKELVKLKKVFDHISGLARLEHSTGVIGFLGIKNIITALAGIKYVMPLNYSVNTRPNFPHVYDVELSLVDFDVFQQKREELSSKQQRDLVDHFGTKRNPFLRIKQLWGSFNAYPDFPLSVVDNSGEIVGHLDPDFYFRSFQMFDQDVVNNLSGQIPKIQNYAFEDPVSTADIGFVATATEKIKEFMRLYNDNVNGTNSPEVKNSILEDIVSWMDENQVNKQRFVNIFYTIVKSEAADYASPTVKYQLLTDFISFDSGINEDNPYGMQELQGSQFQVGDYSPNDASMLSSIEAALEGKYNLVYYDEQFGAYKQEDFVSFHPDEVDFHKQIFSIPASDPKAIESGKIPSILHTAIGVYYGYIDKKNGRFYLTIAGNNVKMDENKNIQFGTNYFLDTQTPDKGTTQPLSGVSGVSALSEYQKPNKGDEPGHWETMMVDTQYRDVSGRMIRAFPTYMLWLIDEGGYFAGAKLFDNFYGLQSIIDFSVVTSEDLLGDTLIFRVSNLYSKLTTKPSTELFSSEDYSGDNGPLNLSQGMTGILDRSINMARNIASGMNDYVPDIMNIRLKPGVRVHLRMGYGANPNALQTVFNGIITNVEQGEIVTVTAQSDAIELGAVVNSTDQKGSSGKIDGGVDTGMYLSEPRDLMVRLLSMGASRVREAFAHATRGTVFSQNKFGIRHFGSILYEPLSEGEAAKSDAIRESITGAMGYHSTENGGNTSDPSLGAAAGFSFNLRSGLVPLMSQMWSNFASQTDLEIFKRNIYPGNGLGVAQFLGGDIDDGWSTVSSIVETQEANDRTSGYLGRLSDQSYNELLIRYQQDDKSAQETVANLTAGNALNTEGHSFMNFAAKGVVGGAAVAGVAALFGPISGAVAGAGLLGVLSGRGGTNLFRTMGILSANPDDDLPGFDEISFRAQTYMRTVWDLFQTCARLLPNYIVAVRPFEDRSTVFYGKPHWLYTSGVVPVTTGYPTKEKAEELGLTKGPKEITPNEVLNKILDTINRDTNPLSDYSAFFEAFEPNETLSSMANDIVNSSGIYAPTQYLAGKVINFMSYQCKNYISDNYEKNSDSQEDGVVIYPETSLRAQMPLNKAKVYIGTHLPVIPRKEAREDSQVWTKVTDTIESQRSLHKQIPNLTPRYQFPYFSTTEKTFLPSGPDLVPLIGGVYLKDFLGDVDLTQSGDYLKLSVMELEEFQISKFSLAPGIGGDSPSIQLDVPLNFSDLNQKIEGAFPIDTTYVTMPIPQTQIGFELANAATIADGTYNDFEFQSENFDLDYSEWGAPETPEDEQFYIAMRWPYQPSGVDQDTLNVWTSTYGLDPAGLYGTAQEYKDRKVLVYNPKNGRAVVCRPAYFLWGNNTAAIGGYFSGTEMQIQASEYDALVSPDAAYFLGVITYNTIEEITGQAPMAVEESEVVSAARRSGYRFGPSIQECYMGWVPDYVPVGVVATVVAPVETFKEVDPTTGEEKTLQTTITADGRTITAPGANKAKELMIGSAPYIIGFGGFSSTSNTSVEVEDTVATRLAKQGGTSPTELTVIRNPMLGDGRGGISTNDPFAVMSLFNVEYYDVQEFYEYAGNPVNIGDHKTFFDAVVQADYGVISKDKLNEFKSEDISLNADKRTKFLSVWNVADLISVQARQYYDEDYDPNVSVIAGNGRTLMEAQEIWDQFRAEYHTYESVKKIFADIFGLNPDSEEEFPQLFKAIITGDDTRDTGLSTLYNSKDGLQDEFGILLGSDYVSGLSVGSPTSHIENDYQNQYLEALDFMARNLVDAPLDKGGLIKYYENIMKTNFLRIYENFFSGQNIENIFGFSLEAEDGALNAPVNAKTLLHDNINSPKQLFLLMVGIFRQRMWEDPYARAWLVLKPDRISSWAPWSDGNGWSFRPVDKIFRAFIDPYQDYAKSSKKAKFLELLVKTRGEGNSSGTVYGEVLNDVGTFVNRTVGPLVGALGGALGGLLSMFKTSMQQLGYALSEVGNFKKQANILNKVLNDSIYYSLGRPGSILRAVDNPFTREYGEPVIEIREPFQRIHYISSFSHILSNQIQENINGVATSITAVSDGKYPVTVALDKGAPAERQVEKTIETGIYYDNMTGSGFFGSILHPLFHPLETIRGIAKNAQGAPDELSARRIALAHLKESIKDIYQGELIVIGSPDIRPHDLVYLSDIYERMYGIFEVEQVIHHFTPELGFITSITPNALVTVNDPARWFATSWMQSWMHVQNIRNDTRIYLDRARSSSSGISYGGNISIDRLNEVLSPELIGGFQYTHGSSALVKDIMANQSAMDMPGQFASKLDQAAQENGGVPTPVLMASAIPLIGGMVWDGWKWIRDNVLDQHGCYVQYLNKNGQPMDAGLSYNQGMAVGQHHSKVLLPGILGVRVKARTPEGYGYIRTDDLFKSLGWRESEINDLNRYISYEAALTHSRVLGIAGIGPDKAEFEWKFRVICKVVDVLDGDTIDVIDVISGAQFRIRFDGVNTSETNTMGGKITVPDTRTPGGELDYEATFSLLDVTTPGGKAKLYVKNALKDKIIIVRINQTRTDAGSGSGGRAVFEDDFEAGAALNVKENYQLDIFGRTSTGELEDGNSRVLGSIMYYFTDEMIDKSSVYIANIFRQFAMDVDVIKNKVIEDIYDKSPFAIHFGKIYDAIDQTIGTQFYNIVSPSDMLYDLPEDQAKAFSVLVYFKVLEEIYEAASQWPQMSWDEYYPDGYPITLNWELVVNNLAKVFVKDLQKESQSVITANESSGLPVV
jgi:hypothetical protein